MAKYRDIFLNAGTKREGTFKRKGKEILKVEFEAIEDITYKDMHDLMVLITDPDELDFTMN